MIYPTTLTPSTAITTHDDAKQALAHAQHYLGLVGIDRIDDVSLQFSGAEIDYPARAVISQIGNGPVNATIRFHPHNDALYFAGILAHELGHVFCHRYGMWYTPDASGLDWRQEGFCHLLMYYYFLAQMTAAGRDHAATLRENTSGGYRAGFVAALRIAQKRGLRRYIADIKSQRDLQF